MQRDRIFTIKELQQYDGDDLPMYIGYNGLVYDVSLSRRWKTGLHEDQHFPGLDLTSELTQAPHGTEVFSRPDILLVGKLNTTYSNSEQQE